MNKRTVKQLSKIDTELMELEERIRNLVEFEQVNGRKTLLMSRVYKKRYESLERIRSRIVNKCNTRLSRQEMYDVILVERQIAVMQATKERDATAQELAQFLATYSVISTSDVAIKQRFYMLKSVLKAQDTILRNKIRAVQNWMKKDKNELAGPRSTAMKSSYGQFKEQLKERINVQDINTNATFESLQQMPNWNKKPENNASIALVSNPEVIGTIEHDDDSTDTFVEENPFLLQEKKKEIII